MTTKVPMPGAHAAVVGSRSGKPSRRASAKSYKEESDDEYDLPPGTNMASQDEAMDEDSSDDEPLIKKNATPKSRPNGKAKTNGTTNGRVKKRKKGSSSEEDDDTEEEKPAKKAKGPPKKRVKKEIKEESLSGDDSLKKPAEIKKKEAKPKKPKKEEKEEEVFKWWELETPEDVEGDGSKKWDTLAHGGVMFPPPYQPLPSSVKMLYDGKPIDLPPESEEVATFFAAMLDTEHAQNDVFQSNFFKDWQDILTEYPPVSYGFHHLN